jgi:hypothetical protein
MTNFRTKKDGTRYPIASSSLPKKLVHVDAVMLAVGPGIFQKDLGSELAKQKVNLNIAARKALGLSTEKYLNGKSVNDGFYYSPTNVWQGEPSSSDFNYKIGDSFDFPGGGTDWDAMKKCISKGLLVREKVGGLYFIRPTQEGKKRADILRQVVSRELGNLSPLTTGDKRTSYIESRLRTKAWFDANTTGVPDKNIKAEIAKVEKEAKEKFPD